MPARVMYVVDHLKLGGAQTHLVQVLALLDRRRFRPMVCALKPRGELARTLQEMGVPVFDGGLGTSLKGWSGVRVLRRLTRLLKFQRVDVAHSYLFHPNVLTPIAGRLAGIPATVASKRSLDRYPSRLPRYACKLGNRLAHRITVNAEAVARFVTAEEGCPPDKMVLIPNGVSEEALRISGDGRRKRQELGVPMDAPVVGAVSRLAWKKGLRYLLDTWPRLVEALPAVRIAVVGDGPLRPELEAQARKLGIRDRVLFLGARQDALELMRAFDVFVLPSLVEGMSNALLEAMAAARPVVATDVGGNSEVMVDGETGFLVPAEDPGALGAAIVKLLHAPELARDMGAAGRRRVTERYRVDIMVRRIEELYESLLAPKAA
ncbi:MAG TPA: glycosyltransferase [Methylomirabilota bacterium]|jgi:glycosyltransferase involved in cell wall biosynthesis|nr:glycosyltransferase [Methylomirabilota bacterium]